MTLLRALCVGVLLLVGCKNKEPAGKAVALESTPEKKADQVGAWLKLADSLQEGESPQLDESLFAVNRALELTRECRSTPEEPTCVGKLEQAAPNLGGLGPMLLWNRVFQETLVKKSGLLVRLGHGKAALKVADEAMDTRPDYPWLHEARGDALLVLKRYDDAIAEYQATRSAGGGTWLLYAHQAQAQKLAGKLADAQATFSELKTKLAKHRASLARSPDMLARAERPGAMLWQVDLLIAELEPSLGTP